MWPITNVIGHISLISRMALVIDFAALDECGVEHDTGGAGEISNSGEHLFGIGLLLPRVCFGKEVCRRPIGRVRDAGKSRIDVQRDQFRAGDIRQPYRLLNCFLG
jgi:hypothetical protein